MVIGMLENEFTTIQGKIMSQEKDFAKSYIGILFQQVINSPGVPLDSSLRATFESVLPANISKISSNKLYADKSALFVTSSNDEFELEAEQIADRLLKSADRAIQSGEEHKIYDLSNIRLHIDAQASALADCLNARAFTYDNHIIFAADQFDPNTSTGRHLLTHELVHCLQQKGSSQSLIQRAETDTRATILSGTRLIDTASDVNNRINLALKNARKTAKGKPELVIEGLYKELGVNGSVGRSRIEDWAEKLGPKKVHLPPKSTTKYKGANYVLWEWARKGKFPILNPTMLINGIYVGSDKLGHFLQQGYDYFIKEKREGKGAGEKFGLGTEKGGFGLATTGVLSNADLEANRQGLKFYQQLESKPNMNFDINNYINNRWNEGFHPNHYIEALARYVWANLLGERQWRGKIKEHANLTDATVKLIVTVPSTTSKTLNVTGEFALKPKIGKPTTGKIVKGEVKFIIGSHNAVSGVEIKFDWKLDRATGGGKGKLKSVKEAKLEGTWGDGIKVDGRGEWKLSN